MNAHWLMEYSLKEMVIPRVKVYYSVSLGKCKDG